MHDAIQHRSYYAPSNGNSITTFVKKPDFIWLAKEPIVGIGILLKLSKSFIVRFSNLYFIYITSILTDFQFFTWVSNVVDFYVWSLKV